MRHLRLALRTLFKTPFVTVVAILSLALGIGANSAIFSLFDQMLLRPLAVPSPKELVNLGAPGPKPGSQSCGQAGDCDEVFSYPMFRDLERVQNVFTTIAAHRIFSVNLAYRNQTISGEGVLVSSSYFPVLGIQPAVGRLLDPRDDQKVGESLVAVLSHSYWLSRFDGNPSVLNETLVVNGQHLTIVGVAPAGFEGTTPRHHRAGGIRRAADAGGTRLGPDSRASRIADRSDACAPLRVKRSGFTTYEQSTTSSHVP
jgi:hypothetical protein